jgi:Secretion system C-terminal sorting domain/Starch binding domain
MKKCYANSNSYCQFEHILTGINRFFLTPFIIVGLIATSLISQAQIYAPQGLNVPGDWNGWTNPPSSGSAFGSANQVSSGRVTPIATGQARWQTQFNVAASGGDITGGTYQFLFTSGPSATPWDNKWANTNVTLNTLQSYTYQGGTNNSITVSNGKWYTMNWIDAGYTGTSAIFMETAAQPVTFSSVSQSPTNGSIASTDPVVVTVNASAAPSSGELVYLRYSTNSFSTSTLVPVSFAGSVGTATIPAQVAATQVDYYVFSTTVSNPASADVDKVTINFKNNAGGNFTYTVNSPLPPVNVTFQVNMSQQSVGGSVYVAGTFTGWSSVAMTNAGGGLYTYTASLNQGQAISYKYVNGASYEGNLGAPCGDGSNRTHTVGSSDETLSEVCFGLCTTCPATCAVTFQVNMSQVSVGGSVYINGSFPPANWSTPQLMTSAGAGVYTYTVNLPQGSSYEYKFINGATYEGNLSAPCGNGSNRTIAVPASSSSTVSTVCFGSCTNCVAPPTTHQVTFQVDMTYAGVTASGVHIAGAFGSNGYADWDPSGIALSDGNGDGIYDVTLSLTENTTYQYKFVNGNAWGSDESVPGGCNVSGNRSFSVGTSNSTVPLVCYASCSACASGPSNNSWTSPVLMITPTFPSCINVSGNLSGCSASSQASYVTAPTGAGQDAWYRFQAPSTSTGYVRITVSSSVNNLAIILQKESAISPYYTQVAVEDASSSTGSEKLNLSGLIPGAFYRIGVKNMSVSTPGAFNICVSPLRAATCGTITSASNGKSLCDLFLGTYTGASSYLFTFTNSANPSESHSYTSNAVGAGLASSAISLANIPGLEYGKSYYVKIDATYTLDNGVGASTTMTIPGTINGCMLYTVAQPSVELTYSDRCGVSSPRRFTSFISTNWACAAIDYEWEITPTTGLPVAVTTMRGSSSRYILVGSLNGIHSGATTFNVRVRPHFSDGIGGTRPGTWSTSTQQLCIIAPASIVEAASENAANQTLRSLEISTETFVDLYPNPNTGDFVQLNLASWKSDLVTISVFDTEGRQVYLKTLNVRDAITQTITFENRLANGLYVMNLQSEESKETHRFVVTH